MIDAGDRVLDRLLLLFNRLRAAGVPVAIVEVIDAVEALHHLDVGDRRLVRAALRATLVKRPLDEAVFDDLFDRVFAAAPLPEPLDTGAAATGPSPGADIAAGPASTELLAAIVAALQAGDLDALRALAALAVNAFAGLDSGDGASERSYLFRVLRALDLATLLQRALRAAKFDATADLTAFEERLRRTEITADVEEFRRLLATELRKRLVELGRLGDESLALGRHGDIDVLTASTTELLAMREAVRPLARALSARIARRRKLRRRGRLDVRRTVRRSLSVGGVPLDPAFKQRKSSKPDLVLLCDVSGSVAEFAHFTLSLVHALHDEFARLRTFVFVDGFAEVTDLFTTTEYSLDPHGLLSQPGVVEGDGHSDYGRVFRRFQVRALGDVVAPTTTIIITGDARTNFRDSGLEAFRELSRTAKHVYWFNPEPRQDWGTDDSAIDDYAPECSGVFEVRTLAQLADAVVVIA
ncbi:MAG: VWA domain-containing protein [Acidimicrobiales bacterium]